MPQPRRGAVAHFSTTLGEADIVVVRAEVPNDAFRIFFLSW